MLCRRCGMESTTTDVCEWCKRPMLPQVEAVQPEGEPEQAGEAEAGAVPARPEAGATEPEGEAEADVSSVLRPLGGGARKPSPGALSAGAPSPGAPSPGAPAPGLPSHGLGGEATETSIDVSEYTGRDQSIFRPIERPETTGTIAGADPLAMRQRGRGETKTVSDISENVRLMRCIVAGIIVCLTFALIQMVMSRTIEEHPTVPNSLIFGAFPIIKNLGSSDSIMTVVLYGALVGIIMGLLLGALLVRLKRGPFVGLLVGMAVGYGLQNPPWGMIAGAAAGIAVGVIATRGLRQVVNV